MLGLLKIICCWICFSWAQQPPLENKVRNYYWKEYVNKNIPPNAVKLGKLVTGQSIYIGKVISQSMGEIMVEIVEGKEDVSFYDNKLLQSINHGIQILCGDPKSLCWVGAKLESYILHNSRKYTVFGGVTIDNGTRLYFNVVRAKHNKETVLGYSTKGGFRVSGTTIGRITAELEDYQFLTACPSSSTDPMCPYTIQNYIDNIIYVDGNKPDMNESTIKAIPEEPGDPYLGDLHFSDPNSFPPFPYPHTGTRPLGYPDNYLSSTTSNSTPTTPTTPTTATTPTTPTTATTPTTTTTATTPTTTTKNLSRYQAPPSETSFRN